jgi:hypothetical protein
MKESIDWSDLSNSEIEVKLKEFEFEYEKLKSEVNILHGKLDFLNTEYINGKFILDKRINKLKID